MADGGGLAGVSDAGVSEATFDPGSDVFCFGSGRVQWRPALYLVASGTINAGEGCWEGEGQNNTGNTGDE